MTELIINRSRRIEKAIWDLMARFRMLHFRRDWLPFILVATLLPLVGCDSPANEADTTSNVIEVEPILDQRPQSNETATPIASQQKQQTPSAPSNVDKPSGGMDTNEPNATDSSAADVPYKDKEWIDIAKIYRTTDSDEAFAYVVLDNRAGRETERGNFMMAEQDEEVETLPAELFAKIKERCLHAEQLMLNPKSKSDVKDAFFEFNEVLSMLPEPAKKWNVSGWVLSRLGELYFRLEAYEDSLPVFDDLMWCPGTIGNPWLHLRKGQVLYEVDEKEGALQELMRAYMGGDKDIFDLEDPKYFKYLQSQVDGIQD